MKNTSVWRHFDLWLTAAVLLLTAYGILAINSAVTGAPAFATYPQRQALFALAGVGVMLLFAAIDYRILTSSHWYIYAVFVASLVFVYLVGVINNASRRWIDLGFIQIQPSEFGRIFLAITLAQFFVPVGLIFLQPDLGMSIVFIVIWFVLIWLAGLPLSHFAVLATVAILTIVVLFPSLADYQQNRIVAFINPESLPEQSFNIEQALISIGSGGWWGKGYLQGTQSQLGFLRVQHTDFIFSVITEEMGLIFGAFVVLGLMTFILIRILRVASLTKDPAGRYIVAGIAAVLFFQTVVSVGMNLRLLPVTGLTLPFVSYGGSSLITLFMAIGIVQSVLMRHRKQEFG